MHYGNETKKLLELLKARFGNLEIRHPTPQCLATIIVPGKHWHGEHKSRSAFTFYFTGKTVREAAALMIEQIDRARDGTDCCIHCPDYPVDK